MALSRVLCPTLIGRESELSLLEDALLASLRGDGGVIILGGEAGMGKTRLVNALAERARRLGCVVASGACSEAELSLPYLPFLEAIGNHIATEDPIQLRERLGSAADELAQLFPQMGRPTAGSGDVTQAKLRLFESILLLLRDAARNRSLLLILEDLQWADPATRELLDYGTRRFRSTNVLVVATYRSDEMHRKHALLPTIQGWRRSGQVEMIELHSLGAQAVSDMICAIFDEASVSDEFRDFVSDRAEGNPFVIEEMLRDAIDRGDIFRTAQGWDRKGVGEMRIPRTVRDAILRRLERLSREDVAALSAASVMGRSFDLATLTAVTGMDQAVVLSALETAVTFQLVEEEDDRSGRYRFRHALTREAVYEDLVMPRRQHLHARVAEVLRSNLDSAPVDLAHHLLAAGLFDEAVVMCVAAAESAVAKSAYRDAAELLERAAPHVKDRVARGRLLCQAGEHYWTNTEPAAARGLLEEGIADIEASSPSEAARWRLVLGRCHWELLRSDLAQEEFDKARAVLEKDGPSEALAVAYIRLSGLITFDRATETSLAYAQRAVEIAEQANAAMAVAWSWNFVALAEVSLGHVGAGFGHLDDSYRLAMEGGYQLQASNAVFNAGYLAVHLGLGDRLEPWYQRASDPVWASSIWTRYFRSLMSLYQGRVQDALDLARLASQRSRDAGHEKQAWRSVIAVAHALAENMDPRTAADLLPPLSSRVEGQDTVYDATARIRTKLALGDPEGAFQMAKTVAPEVCDLVSPADVVAEAARSDPAWLRGFLEQLAVQGECLASPRMAAALGRLALYEGRFADALLRLGEAVRGFEDGRMMLDAWHLGRALAEAEARSGNIEAARSRLKGIVIAAEAAGARLAAELARQTAVGLGMDVGAASEAPLPAAGPARVQTGERMVSVLFADVRGYTEIVGGGAPAQTAERIGSLQRWAGQEVSRRHGIVDKFAGDAIMATFNVSGQSIDHTLQALRAAIGIIDKAGLAGLPIGAGLAVGPAVVGNLADGANMSVLGEVTNLAARLQGQSAAGEVTLSEEAYRRVREWLDGQHLPVERVELELKGFASPLVAFRVKTAVVAVSVR